MKKLLSMILAIATMLTVAIGIVPESVAVTHGYLLGDANDDNNITISDVLAVRKFIAGIYEEKDLNTKSADVNEDKGVTISDVLLLRKFLVGIVDLEENNTDGEYKVDKVSIGDRNIARYTIILPQDADPCAQKASRVLADWIDNACGYTMNISNDESGIEGYKIRFIHDNAGENELGWDGYRIMIDADGDLNLICGAADHQRGALYSVYHILEEYLGYRFLIADDYGSEIDYYDDDDNKDVVYLYPSECASVPEGLDETLVPQITYRALSQRGRSSTNFLPLRLNDTQEAHKAENGWRVGTLYIHAHSYAYQMAGIEHAYDNDKYINEHKLHDTQPCLTSEETYEKIVEYNTWLIEDRKTWGAIVNGVRVGNDVLGHTYTQVSCSPNDNTDFCICSDCTKVYAEEGSIAGTVFRLANRVSEKLEETYPTLETYTIAYWDARRPPKITRPRDSICVCYCIGGCNNHSYDHTEQCAAAGGNPRLYQKNWDGTSSRSSNVDDIDYYLKWTELTNNIQIWYYSCNYTYYLAPAPNIFNIYNDIKYLASTGTNGVYFEGSGSAKYSFEYLRGYLASKMMWDPFMSEEEYNDLIDEFLWIFYGEGWQYVRQYLDMVHFASDQLGCWTNNFDRPWDMNNEEYFKEHYKDMAILFDNAYAEAKTEKQRKRVLTCRMQCDFLGLSATYDRDWVNGDADSRAEYKARYVHLFNYIKNNNVRVASVGSTYGCENFPSNANDENIINPMEWLWEGCNGHWN
ncbi:MAG: DUF4838 domain-containing protein [Clostridia bacterium]|nr:DUF4838 domain-containing protein [Clostridia bacterium]